MAEFRACRTCLTSVNKSALGKGEFLGISANDVAAALLALEGTYFLRMSAEAERAMRLHLATHFPHVKVTQHDGFGRLLKKCANNYDPSVPGKRMPAHLFPEAEGLTSYRNNQAHSLRLGFSYPDIYTAQSKLSRFLFSLPS